MLKKPQEATEKGNIAEFHHGACSQWGPGGPVGSARSGSAAQPQLQPGSVEAAQ